MTKDYKVQTLCKTFQVIVNKQQLPDLFKPLYTPQIAIEAAAYEMPFQ